MKPAQAYQCARKPKRICRSPVALVICMNVPEVTLVDGAPKWDVFGMLKNSPRNSAGRRSRIRNLRRSRCLPAKIALGRYSIDRPHALALKSAI